jgi:hypothetical protein
MHSGHTLGPSLEPGWAELAFLSLAVLACTGFLRGNRVEVLAVFPALVAITAFSAWIALAAEPYRAVHSLVPIAPYLVIALVTRGEQLRQPPMRLLALLSALYLLFGVGAVLAFYLGPSGLITTLEWGPRYILTLYPLAAILAVLAVSEYWRTTNSRPRRIALILIFAAMVVVGVQFQVRGVKMLYATRHSLAELDRTLRAQPPIVTDAWWLPALVADLATTSDMFFVYDSAALDDWLAQARRNGVRQFTFVSRRSTVRSLTRSGAVRLLNEARRVRLHIMRFEFVVPTDSR